MLKKGDIVIDPENKSNIYTILKVRRTVSSAFLMIRWRDNKKFYFDVSASNNYFKKLGMIQDNIAETINIEGI